MKSNNFPNKSSSQSQRNKADPIQITAGVVIIVVVAIMIWMLIPKTSKNNPSIATAIPTIISIFTPIPPITTNTAIPTEIILPTPTAIPQTDVITGKVYVLDTNKPIQITVLLLDASSGDSATVLSTPAVQKTISDSNGQYVFRNVKPGTYIVAVEGHSQEVSFCGTNYGLAEYAIGPSPIWDISYMRLENKLTMNAGGFLQQDIVIKCK